MVAVAVYELSFNFDNVLLHRFLLVPITFAVLILYTEHTPTTLYHFDHNYKGASLIVSLFYNTCIMLIMLLCI